MPHPNWITYAVFTLNNYEEQDIERLRALGNSGRVSYLLFGYEVGESGTRHLQGYVEYARSKRFHIIKRAISERCHLEARRGTAQEAADYCKKDGDYEEFGTMSRPQPGRRSDLEQVRDLAVNHGIRSLFQDNYNLQAIKYGLTYLDYVIPQRCLPCVWWITGETGVGKTVLAQKLSLTYSTAASIYYKNTPTKWWPGYDGHTVCILDDLDEQWECISRKSLLAMLDSLPYYVEQKGAGRWMNVSTFIITSPLNVRAMETALSLRFGELHRRVTRSIHIHSAEQMLEPPGSGSEVRGNTYPDPYFGTELEGTTEHWFATRVDGDMVYSTEHDTQVLFHNYTPETEDVSEVNEDSD